MNEENRENPSKLVVCLDDPKQHTSSVKSAPRNASEPIGWSVMATGHRYEVVQDIKEAERILQQEKVDYLIIHHSSFSDVDNLRPKFPNVKFVGTSGMLLPQNKCRPGSIAEEYRNNMAAHYDVLLDDWDEEVHKMLGRQQ